MNGWTLELWTLESTKVLCPVEALCSVRFTEHGSGYWLVCGLGGCEHCMSSEVNVTQSVYLETPLKNMDDNTLAANLKTLRDAQVECPIRFRWMLLSQPCS